MGRKPATETKTSNEVTTTTTQTEPKTRKRISKKKRQNDQFINTDITLAAKHEIMTNNFIDKDKKISSIKTEIDNIKTQINNINKIPFEKLSELNRLKLTNLNEELEKLNQDLINTENNTNEISYHITAAKHIKNYYNDEKNKEDHHENYLLSLSDKYVPKNKRFNKQEWCNDCNKEKQTHYYNGVIVCEKCGDSGNVIIEDAQQTYIDGITSHENAYFSYKKITHLKEWIKQCQEKDKTNIPENIYIKIYNYIQENFDIKLIDITGDDIKYVLQELKLTEYNDQREEIANKVSGRVVLSIPRAVEDKLEKMFQDIQIAFKKCLPENRKNFLSYPYTLHKCLQLIGGCDEFLDRFLLLKSEEKLQTMDAIWKNICQILEWKFISSSYYNYRK